MEKGMEKHTLGEQAAEKLLAMIQQQSLEPGSRLPTEAELTEILGVGRNTVREALRILMSRNIVTIRQGSGTFVSEKQGVADDPLGFALEGDKRKLTRDLLQVRLILEPDIAALAAENALAEDIQKLEAILEQIEDRMEKRQDYWEQDSCFHVQIAVCSHNSVMSKLIPVISQGVSNFAISVQETEYTQTLASHRAIFEAIKNRRPLEAREEMRYHLMYNRNRYMKEQK